MEAFKEIMIYSPKNQEVFKELLGLCRNKMIVPYIGAGMSAFAGLEIPNVRSRKLFPTWTNLIGAKYAEYFKDKKLPKDLIDAADEIEKTMGREEFYEYIRVTMGGNLNEEWIEILKNVKNQAISVIPKLFFCPMVTTNFDQIIERIYNEKISVAFPYHTENLGQAIDERKQLLYKIHGCVSDAQNIVLAKSKYDEVYNSESHLVKSLSKFCQGFHFLFLGCSLTLNDSDGTKDYSTKLLLDQQGKSKMPHYAIIECKENATEDEIKVRRKELEKEHIFPILYKFREYGSVKIILDEILRNIENQLFQIPKYDKPYTERKDSIIVQITSRLEKSKHSVLAIRGDAGVGKTRVIREYALQNEKKYSGNIFWFSAISADNVREEVRKFVVKYQNISEEETDTNIIFQAFKKWAKENENYLFLLDNVENYEDIKVFLDSDFLTLTGTRHVLITSRLDKDKLPNIPILPIKEFELEESRSFLQSHTDTEKYNEEYADKIASLLGNLPLALEQAAAMIQSDKKETYKKFYEELEKEPFGKLEKMHPEHGAAPVAATWNMTMQRINSDAAKELLWLCAYFAPDNINNQWFVKAEEVLPKKLKNDIQTKLNEIEGQLKKYSLVKINNDKISIHRLLQRVIRKTKEDEQEKLVDICVRILNRQPLLTKNKYQEFDFSTAKLRSDFMDIASHVIALTNYSSETYEIAELHDFLGYGFEEIADYSNSLKHYNKALIIYKNVLGEKHSDTATTYNNIALVWFVQGNYYEALKWYEKALDTYKEVLGERHPYTAIAYNNMALTYSELDNYSEALKLHEEALNIREEVLGENHPDTAQTYNNIGTIYNEQGNYSEALKLYQKALVIREETLGECHPETAQIYDNIGTVYREQGSYLQALELHRKTLNIRKNILGENHPDTAFTYKNIALVYDKQGDYFEALNLFLIAFNIYLTTLGLKHPFIQNVLNNMEITYNKINSNQSFEKWLKEANNEKSE